MTCEECGKETTCVYITIIGNICDECYDRLRHKIGAVDIYVILITISIILLIIWTLLIVKKGF